MIIRLTFSINLKIVDSFSCFCLISSELRSETKIFARNNIQIFEINISRFFILKYNNYVQRYVVMTSLWWRHPVIHVTKTALAKSKVTYVRAKIYICRIWSWSHVIHIVEFDCDFTCTWQLRIHVFGFMDSYNIIYKFLDLLTPEKCMKMHES